MQIPDNIKMVLTDFDGVFTDNTVIINEDGSISRRVSFKDVMGVSLLVKNGVDVAIISGEKNSAIEKIRTVFKLQEIHQNIRVKIDVVKDILERHNLSVDEVVYIGDDVNDLESLEYVSTKITVPNANKRIKKIDGIQITEAVGGDGAFRELADAVLEAKGL